MIKLDDSEQFEQQMMQSIHKGFKPCVICGRETSSTYWNNALVDNFVLVGYRGDTAFVLFNSEMDDFRQCEEWPVCPECWQKVPTLHEYRV